MSYNLTICSRGGSQIFEILTLIQISSNAFNPVLYADVALGKMAALNNLDASPARLASETLMGSSPDPSPLMMPSKAKSFGCFANKKHF